MPLPKEYYNIVGQGSQTGIKTFPGMSPPGITYPNYHGMFEEEELEPTERGTFKDLAENLWGGAVSGLTWSAVDLQDKDWEGMNTMERTGWILGEGASLFAPIGPFGLLGKAGRAAARGLGNRFTTQLAKEAGELSIQQTDSLLKGVNAVAKKTGRSSDEIIASLDNNVQRGLRKTIGDDVGISWVNEMGIGGVKAAQAQELLVKSGSAAVTKALESPGTETALKSTIAGAATGLDAQVMQRGAGAVMNPNMELLFNGPQLRNFGFTFKLSPRNADEAKTIIKIMRFFKQGMAPIRTEEKFFLKAPHTFELKYQGRGAKGDQPYLNKFKECALTNCGVQYTPDGNYNTFNDGVMTSYSMQLTFNELTPIYNDDYSGLDGDEDTMIGY